MEPVSSEAKAHGDDLSPDELARWYADEKEATCEGMGFFAYRHHGLSWYHGWRHLPKRRFRHVLGFGAAYGAELEYILPQVDRVTVLEPSDGYANPRFHYVKPDPSGIMPFADSSFDLITCFGVLHHIANVSTIFAEFYRVLEPRGFALVREPIVELGDFPHRTKHERGIPLPIYDHLVERFEVVHRAKCHFRPLKKIADPWFNSKLLAAMDAWICRLPWPQVFHATRTSHKFAPMMITYVLRKP